MNCRRVEKLMPLYIEGDLRFKLASRVKLHVDGCGRCSALADEFKESQSWLRSAEPPEFDDAFFNDLKGDVLKQAEDADVRTSVLASLAAPWSRRELLALTATIFVMFGAIALYFYRSTKNVSPAISGDIAWPAADKLEMPKEPQPTVVAKVAPGAGFKRRRHVAQAVGLRTLISRDNQQTAAERMNSLLRGGDTRSDRDGNSKPMLRIEFQTSDPNIRIIWFAPSQTDSHQPKPTTD